ncbi:phthalate 4,5-dioxygenase [Pigmentiphaga sp. NML080357]|uniref:aromatic ring-hydroxylating dioxygenase subunit alpha n=1 Tax=Pigmentiphaga sp. NML080357 TaxID=2008675 RepID=UPI000B409507|nr:aromatic ring-hydroxylating dioxygenase subunit alpha [Pigmentiphaga sp. NML080357]OVZ56606.1 phthalate 4,5-dioxygenase [Pigmentiphaga sp. NML080357]
MLNQEKNELLTRVGPGTPMGELLRRYWMPVAGVTEFDGRATKAVRIMGEDLVLYRDLSGNWGLVDRHCPHRRADLSHGFPEARGLRCNYHGWCFDGDGACLEQPYEDVAHPEARMKDRIRIKAYPVAEKAGLLWAYMGPAPAPLLPDWEAFSWPNGFRQIVLSEIPCNWFQCQENSIDPVHFEWMHNNWSLRQRGVLHPYSPSHKEVGFEEFEYGFLYKRIRGNAKKEDPLWAVGRVCLWPNAVFLGDHFEWRVPVDDERTLSVCWSFTRVPKEREPYVQETIPTWHGPICDADGNWITSHVMNQDFVAWVGQGTIADRSLENLSASDRGITMIRKKFFEELEAVAGGADPKGVLRDPEKNRRVELPLAFREVLTEGMTWAELKAHPIFGRHLHDYIFQAGQPEAVAQAYREAMGLDGDSGLGGGH